MVFVQGQIDQYNRTVSKEINPSIPRILRYDEEVFQIRGFRERMAFSINVVKTTGLVISVEIY